MPADSVVYLCIYTELLGEWGRLQHFAFPLVFQRLFALESQDFNTIKQLISCSQCKKLSLLTHIAVTRAHVIIYTQFILE